MLTREFTAVFCLNLRAVLGYSVYESMVQMAFAGIEFCKNGFEQASEMAIIRKQVVISFGEKQNKSP